jgi:hypothetical protein
MNKIKYSDLDTWNNWDVGIVLEKFADETKDLPYWSSERDKIKERYIKLAKLQVINYGHIMETEDFAQSVENGYFNCFDGIGYYMDENGEESRIGISFNPEEIRKEAATYPYVAWYNK